VDDRLILALGRSLLLAITISTEVADPYGV
jgi:hypothetical protein